jgi:phosphoglycerate kinase
MVVKMDEVTKEMRVLDIGPETQAKFGNIILMCHTIVWNGPVGFMENPQYARGTDFLFYTIAQNHHATSIVGGGETLSSISKMEHLDAITHISSGGGAMLEFIEKGTLPGIEALKNSFLNKKGRTSSPPLCVIANVFIPQAQICPSNRQKW